MKAQVTTALVKRRTVTITLDEDDTQRFVLATSIADTITRCRELQRLVVDALETDRAEDARREDEDVPF